MRGEKLERNLAILEDSKTLSVRDIAAKHNITPARVHVILTKLRDLQDGQSTRVLKALELTEQRLVSMSTEIAMTLTDLRTLRRLIQGANESASQDN